MAKIQEPNFDRSEIPISQRNDYPEVELIIQQALSRLLGYDRINEIWRALNVDPEGNLGISLSLGNGETMEFSSVVLSTSATLIVAARSNRKALRIKNITSSGIAYYSSSPTISTSTGFQLVGNEEHGYTGYIGSVYGIRTSASTIHVMEVY